MRLKKLMLAAAAVSMTASPVLAAQPVATIDARSSEEVGESQLRGGGGALFVALFAVAAVIAAIIIVADSDDEPNSP